MDSNDNPYWANSATDSFDDTGQTDVQVIDPTPEPKVKFYFEEGSVRGRISPRAIKKHVMPWVINDKDPDQNEIGKWISRKPKIYLVFSGFFWPIVIAFSVTVLFLTIGTTFHYSIPWPVKLSGLGSTTTTIASHSTQTTAPFGISVSGLSHLHLVTRELHKQFTIPAVLFLIMWLIALLVAWLLVLNWLFSFFIITDHTLIILKAQPPFMPWVDYDKKPLSLEYIQGIDVDPGHAIPNLLHYGWVTAENNLSAGEANDFKHMGPIRRHREFVKVLDACRLAVSRMRLAAKMS